MAEKNQGREVAFAETYDEKVKKTIEEMTNIFSEDDNDKMS